MSVGFLFDFLVNVAANALFSGAKVVISVIIYMLARREIVRISRSRFQKLLFITIKCGKKSEKGK